VKVDEFEQMASRLESAIRELDQATRRSENEVMVLEYLKGVDVTDEERDDLIAQARALDGLLCDE